MSHHTDRDLRRERVTGERSMAFVDEGDGAPIVFLHGNPTSSLLWRNVLPHVRGRGRLIAPDLMGMGASDKLDSTDDHTYRFAAQADFVERLLGDLGVDSDVTLVLHDWGSAIGFDWANRHRGAVRAIAYMEAIVAPLRWTDFPDGPREFFRALRGPEGEQMILQDNAFVEQMLFGDADLHDEVKSAYRRPFQSPGETRRPTLTLPRQLPIEGAPVEVHERVAAYSRWLTETQVPKLFVNADPGALLVGRLRELARTFPNQTEVTVPGGHFVQEASPADIGRAIGSWLDTRPWDR